MVNVKAHQGLIRTDSSTVLSAMATNDIPTSLACVRGMRYSLKLLATIALLPLLIVLLLSSARTSSHGNLAARNLHGIGGSDGLVAAAVANLTSKGPDEDSAIIRPCSQPERLLNVQAYCEKHPELRTFTKHPMSKLDKFHVFLVDEKHKLLFCAVPKAAVTLWRTMFLHGTGKVNEQKEKLKPYHGPYLNRMGLKFLYNYTAPQQEEILKNYFKVMSVRHPVERALSSYMDKFVYSELEFPILEEIDYINQNYRHAENQIRLTRGRQTIPSGVEFPEFVDMVLDEKAPYNIHWDSIIHICHPCLVQYDYIMKTETMLEDAPFILSLLSKNLEKPLQLAKIHSHRNAVFEDPDKPHDYTKALPELRNITDDKLNLFVKNYQRDMDMFGYQFNQGRTEVGCGFDNLGRGRCC